MSRSNSEAHYVAIEGVIGAGKTSLARLLARELDARLALEIVEENPFLARFYADPTRHAFATQIFFANQPQNTIDPQFRKELAAPVTDGRDGATATFNIVLNM